MFKVATNDPHTLKWWHSNKEDIDFEPPYQRRGGIWSNNDKAYLIDTIINGYDIPKIYMADFTYRDTPLNIGRRPYAIIDGRQRFEAIYDFFDNRLPLNFNIIYQKDPSVQLGGLFYSDVRNNFPKIASSFEEYHLQVMSVITDDEARINDLFVRLNKSKPLNGAEVRNAMSGIVPDLNRSIARHPFFETRIRFQTRRAQDKNAAAKLLLIEYNGSFADTKRTQLDRFVEVGLKTETDIEALVRAKDRVLRCLDNLVKVFVPNDPLLTSEGLIPVYYWLVRSFGPQDELRVFLNSFDSSRKSNRLVAKKDLDRADQELLRFDLLNRSTNDQNSLQGRYKILEKKYIEFSGNLPVKPTHLF